MEKLFCIKSNVQTHYYLKLDFQTADRRTGESKHDMMESECSTFNPISKGNVHR